MNSQNVEDDALTGVEPSEDLGRGVFSGKKARRSRSSVPHTVFLERAGNPTISVDRLSVASLADAADHMRDVALAGAKSFYGWAVVTAGLAASSGRRVSATPQPDNPFHADIELPDPAQEEREEQIRHARELADASRWKPAPAAVTGG